MRKLITQLIKAVPLLALVLTFTMANAQIRYAPLAATGASDFLLSVQNMTQPTAKTLEFDVYLLDADATEPFELASMQFGFLLNSAIYTGGTLSGVINNSTSGLIPAQQFAAAVSIVSTVNGYPGQTLVRLAGKVPPGAGNGTIISQTGFGTLLTHFVFTSTVDFAGATPNFVFNSSTAITPLYATRVAQYVGTTNTQLDVIPGTNATFCCNPCLNCVSCVAPLPFAVTGGGAYCVVDAGLPVGLANSQAGVTYTLYKDGVAQVPTVAGTDAAITFGNQLAGTYTVVGSKVCPDLTVLTTPMTGSAIITVNPQVTPLFTGLGPYCVGATPGALLLTSTNGIAGTWSPAAISTATAGTSVYTFTPNAGQCATTATMSVVVNANVVPVFTGLGPYCVGATPGALLLTSTNGIAGTWNPAVISTAAAGTTVYTFTPNAGQCATTATMSVVVNAPTTPTFAQLGPYCVGATPGILPGTSLNGISGTWNPATISTVATGTITYTFTPTAGECATTATMDVVVSGSVTPTFTQLGPYCVGATPDVLPLTSLNGITGTWNAAISTATAGTTVYTFTPTSSPCATAATMSVVVNANVVPLFTGLGPYCVGATPGTLLLTSTNGIAGTWSPAAISTATAGTSVYTFTPNAGQCGTTATMSVVVNANVVPTFTQLGPYFVGDTPGLLPLTSLNGITGTWNPAVISTAVAGTAVYAFTPDAGQCATGATMSVVTNALPIATAATWNGSVNGDWFTAANWTTTPGGAVLGATTAITIPGGVLPNYLTLSAPATCATIMINDGGSFIGAEFLTVGTSTVKRNIAADLKFHYLSAPVSGATFGNVFANSLTTWAKKWDPNALPAGAWVWQTSLNSFAVGAGYAVTTTNPSMVANFVGPLNKVDATSTLSNAAGGWNLLGNPFQSAIDWDNVVKGPGVSSSVAVWNGANYIYWNSTTQLGGLAGGIIPAENGFFASTTVNGDFLTVPLTARLHSAVPFYKESLANVLELQAYGNNESDQMFVHFNNDATAAYDNQFDARKLYGEAYAPQLYSIISNDVLAINELPMAGNEVIDLGFSCNADGEYSLTASGMESFDASTPILLEDMKVNTTQNLRETPVYSFSYVAGENVNRFKLHFKSTTGINDPSNSGISVYSYDHNVMISNTTSLAGEVWVYDMTGRVLIHTNLSSQMTTSIPMQAAIGTYMVKVVTNKASVNHKVFIR